MMKKIFTLILLLAYSLVSQAQTEDSKEPIRINVNDNLVFYTALGDSPIILTLGDASDVFVNADKITGYTSTNDALYIFGDKVSITGGPSTGGFETIGLGEYNKVSASDLNLSIADISDNRISLIWNAQHDADGYLIFRTDNLGGEFSAMDYENPYAVIAGAAIGGYDDNEVSLGLNTVYRYQMLAYRISDSYWISALSDEVEKVTTRPKYTVSNLNEYIVNHNISITADALSNTENNTLIYKIKDNDTFLSEFEGELHLYENDNTGMSWDYALSLDGEDNEGMYIEFPVEVSNLTDDWTVEMVIKQNDSESTPAYLVTSDFSVIGDGEGKLQLVSTDGALIAEVSYTAASDWLHFTMVKSSTNFLIYANGSLATYTSGSSPATTVTTPISIGQYKNVHFFKEAQLGMVRVWKSARSAHQIVNDNNKLYRNVESNTQPQDLVNEWIWDIPNASDNSGLLNNLLSVKSTDLEKYTATWSDVSDEMISAGNISFTQYVTPGSSHDYDVLFYEQGSGLLLATISAKPNGATAADKLVVQKELDPEVRADPSLVEAVGECIESTEKYSVKLEYLTNLAAERFIVKRQEIGSDVIITLGDLTFDTDSDCTSSSYSKRGVYFDTFDGEDENSIVGNTEYTYTITPYYEYTEHSGTPTIISSSTYTSYFTATPATDQVDLSWDQSRLASTFSADTVLIIRDAEIIARLVDQGAYTDTDMTYGKTHTYGVHPLVNGEQVFAEYVEAGVDANGAVSGWLLSENGFFLSNFSLEAATSIGGDVGPILTSEADGSFSATDIFYDAKATFELGEFDDGNPETKTADSNDFFTLSKQDNELTNQIIVTDYVVTNTQIEPSDFGYIDQTDYFSGSSYVQFATTFGCTVCGNHGPYRVPVMVTFRDDVIIGFTVASINTRKNHYNFNFTDTTGVPGQSYEYKILAQYYDEKINKFYYNYVIKNIIYPEVPEVGNLTVKATKELDNTDVEDAVVINFDYENVSNTAVGYAIVDIDLDFTYKDFFKLYRRADTEGAEETLIQEFDFDNTKTDPYSYTDYTGIPGATYTYYVTAGQGANESDYEGITIEYPSSSWEFTVVNTSSGNSDYLEFELTTLSTEAELNNGNVDGLVVIDAQTQAHVHWIPMTDFRDVSGTITSPKVYFLDTKGDDASRAFYLHYYKSNENGKVVFANTSDTNIKSISREKLGLADLNTTFIEGAGFYKVSWTTIGSAAADERRAYKTVISKNKNSTTGSFEVDHAKGSWAGEDGLGAGTRYLLQVDSEGSIASSNTLDFTAQSNKGYADFPEIGNLTVSKDLRTGVVLTWEYEDFADAGFEIFRDGIKVNTVAPGVYSYVDLHHATDNIIHVNEAYAYQVRAIYDQDGDGTYELFSPRATATGMRRVPFVAEGFVYDTEKRGVPYIDVNIGKAWTKTDRTGYYQLTDLYYGQGEEATLRIRYQEDETNSIEYDSKPLQFDESQLTYINHFKNIKRANNILENRHRTAADGFAVSAYPDPESLSVQLNMQLTNDNYDGVKVSTGNVVIAELDVTDALTYVDNDPEYGLWVNYCITPYLIDTEGEEISGITVCSDQMTAPSLSAPDYLLAEATDEGYVSLQWFMPCSAGRSFDLYRNGDLYSQVEGDFYTDESGLLGQPYLYEIFTKANATGELSESSAKVEATYPLLPGVRDFDAETNESTGEVTLSWNYEDNENIVGYQVWKNDALFATGSIPDAGLTGSTTVVDDGGIPGALAHYSMVVIDDNLNVSKDTSILITYPDLPKISSFTFDDKTKIDTTIISWDYELVNVSGFYISIDNEMQTFDETFIDTIVEVTGEEDNSYEYIWTGGIAGYEYDVKITPYTERTGEDGESSIYKAPGHKESHSFDPLPTEIEVAIASGYEAATTISWEYESFNYHKIIITLFPSNKSTEILKFEVNEPSQRYQNVTLEDGVVQGERYTLSFEAVAGNTKTSAGSAQNLTLSGDKTLTLRDYELLDYSEAKVSSESEGLQISFNLTETSTIKVWPGSINLYRKGDSGEYTVVDAMYVAAYNAEKVTLVDIDATAGVVYQYKVVYEKENSDFKRTILSLSGENLNLPGTIDGLIFSGGSAPEGLPGIAVTAVATVDGIQYTYESTSEVDGSFKFEDLRVEDASGEAVTYTLTPGDGDRVFNPESQTLALSSGVVSRSLNQSFLDVSIVTFQGQLSYIHGEAKSGERNIAVYGVQATDDTENLLTQGQTEGGAYDLEITLSDAYSSYQLRMADQGENSEVDYVYDYYETTESGKYHFQNLAYGDVIETNFIDTLTVSTTLYFKDACGDGIDGYRWKLSVMQQDESFSELVYTDTNQDYIELDLAPVNYEIRVMDVSPLTSESKAMLEFFRGEQVTFNHGDSLLSFTKTEQKKDQSNRHSISVSTDFVTDYSYTFLPDPVFEMELSTFSTSEGHYVSKACIGDEAGGFWEVGLHTPYNLKVKIKNESDCELTEGYILIRNNASEKVFAPDSRYVSDKLVYVTEAIAKEYGLSATPYDRWMREVLDDEGTVTGYEDYAETAGNINVAKPYTRLIEAYYYTDQGRYVATGWLTVVITGTKAMSGQDFLFDIESDEQLVPLYVLHDPPGDNSSATINAGSSISYSFDVNHDGNIKYKNNVSSTSFVGGLFNGVELVTQLDVKESYNQNWGFSLNFSESISTPSSNTYDPNFIEYITGDIADVIVGVGLIQQYGMGRKIAVGTEEDACERTETLELIVEPKELTTDFVYTVHEILTSLRYYKILLEDPTTQITDESLGNLIDEDDDGDVDKADLLVGRIENLNNILLWHQEKYRVPVQVCDMTKHIKKKILGARQWELGIDGKINNIMKFCNNDQYMAYRYSERATYDEATGEVSVAEESDWGKSYHMITEDYVVPQKDLQGDNQDDLKLQGMPWAKKRVVWDDATFEKFDKVMADYMDVLVAYEVHQLNEAAILDYDADRDNEFTSYSGFDKIGDLSENRTFSGLVPYSRSLTVNRSASDNLKQGISTEITAAFKTGLTLENKTATIFGMAIMVDSHVGDVNAKINRSNALSIGFSVNFNQKVSKSNSMNISYKLYDDDAGDHFNVWTMTDPSGYLWDSSPEFALTSGKSSCPYEDGTIARDQVSLTTINEQGEVVPNVIVDQSIDEDLFLPFRLTNEAPFREVRFYRMFLFKEADLSTEDTGLGTQDMEEVQILGDPDFERDIILFDHWSSGLGSDEESDNSPGYKDVIWKDLAQWHEDQWDHVEFVAYVAPSCAMTFREAVRTAYDVYFDRPASEVTLPTERGDWLINARPGDIDPAVNEEDLGPNQYLSIELDDMEVENEFYELEEVYLEIRNKYDAQNDWVLVSTKTNLNTNDTDYTLNSGYSREELSEMGEFPVVLWIPADTIPDGDYQIRASIVGDDDGFYQTQPWDGRIDQTKPYPAKLPEPADGLLSKGDAIGVKISEEINSGLFYALPDNHTIRVFELDGSTPYDFREGTGGFNDVVGVLTYDQDPTVSDYTIFANESEIDIVIKNSILDEIDGLIVTVEIVGVEDLAGNVGADIKWTFQSDHENYPVTEISLYDPEILVLNSASGSASAVELTIADLDVFETQSVLDEIWVQYSHDGHTWITSSTHTIQDLRATYQSMGLSTVTTNLTGLSEGDYKLRLQAWGLSNFRNSNEIELLVDMTPPEILSIAPGLLTPSDEVITIEFSEAMDLSAATVTATLKNPFVTIPAVEFQAFTLVAHNGLTYTTDHASTMYIKLDEAHADYALLYAAYGNDLSFTISGATDRADNALTGTVNSTASTTVGNFTTTLPEITLTPGDWSMNKTREPIDLTLSNMDLFGTEGSDWEGIRIQVLETGEVLVNSDGYEIDYTKAQFEQWHALGELGTKTAPEKTWAWKGKVKREVAGSMTNVDLEEGSWTLNAVAYSGTAANGDLKEYHSADINGVMDFTSPMFTGSYTPTNDSIEADDYTLSLSFTEKLSEKAISEVEILYRPNGSNSTTLRAQNNDLWMVKNRDHEVLIQLSDDFKSIYENTRIIVRIVEVEDPAGNVLEEHVTKYFEMDSYKPTFGYYGTDFSGARLETGENELSWTSYQAFDQTILERSRNGVDFTMIAEYDGSENYHIDEVNFSKVIFYRLTQTTAEGRVHMTKAIAIENPAALPLLNVHLYPSLLDGTEVSLSVLTNDAETALEIEVSDIKGMIQQAFRLPAEDILNSNATIKFSPALKPGMHLMTIKQGESISIKKLIVQ
ncbi:MAG: LamG-like jellyroll fold domain-containing protein [Reichenbachiella sp.]|uniref:LamG-like jellyroll fold domain-containing protein n=1 Tax=Reichenbachiella sp. TaxID=2184521 RepID=UPI003266E3EB